MDNLHLVTGYLGEDHITAMDQGAFNAALIGTGDFVLKKGNVFRAQVIDNSTVRVYDGELMMQGRFVRLEPGKYVDLAIDSGAQGMMRNDLIVARYTKSETTGIEGVNLVVVKGTAVASNPLDPVCTEGDITNGNATKHDFPLWRISLEGLNVNTTPVALFGEPYNDSMQTLPDIRNQMAQLKSEIFAMAAGIETGNYTGGGTQQKIISSNLHPLLVIVSEETGGVGGRMVERPTTAVFIRGVTKYLAYTAQSGSLVKEMWQGLVWNDKSLRIQVVDTSNMSESEYEPLVPYCCFDAKGVKYHYVIVGN